jgi:secreted trypsin-like serine protease
MLSAAALAALTVAIAPAVAAPESSARQGAEFSPRIINGGPIGVASAPWQVALVTASVADNYNAQFCGGSLLSSTTVATAAHCVPGLAPSAVQVLAGVGSLSESTTRIGVSAIVSHPSYNAGTSENDVAILTLQTPVSLDGVSRAAIALPPPGPSSTSWPPAGTSAFVTGWGNTSTSGSAYPTQLQGVTVRVLTDPSTASCGSYPDPSGNAYDATTMLCAADTDPARDSCQGDSGGPLAIERSGTWTLAGVVSWGYGCANPAYPGVYARVTTYRDWLLGQASEVSTPPGQPTGLTVAPGMTTADVSWAAPSLNGGSPITSYTATASPGGAACTTAAAATSCTISGLSPGTAYSVTVIARNSVGPGFDSAAVATTTAAPAPAAPAPAAPAPVAAVPDPCAGLSGLAATTCDSRAGRDQQIAAATATRDQRRATCATRRNKVQRTRCITAANATYTRAVKVARAKATRTISRAKCDEKSAQAKRICTTTANATYTRTVKVATALRARTIARATCTQKKGTQRTRCIRTANARYTRTVKIQNAVRTRTIARARCTQKKGTARKACTSKANARYRVAVARARGR